VHHEVPAIGRADQASDCGLPFLKILLSLRQLHDVSGGIFESDKLATAEQGNRVIEWPFPARCFTRSDARAPA
jgi:hypothetical protein